MEQEIYKEKLVAIDLFLKNKQCSEVHCTTQRNKLYLTFLFHKENTNRMEDVNDKVQENEYLQLIDNVMYFHCPDGVSKSKITNNLIEKKLEVKATARNWRTCGKLLSLVN